MKEQRQNRRAREVIGPTSQALTNQRKDRFMAATDLTAARSRKLSHPREVTAELVRHLFDYDAHAGVFTWKNPIRHQSRAGQTAGGRRPDGYVILPVCGTRMFAHRAAWLFVHGELPEDMVVDHVNQDPSDNRIANLRLADKAENGWNHWKKDGAGGVQRNSKGSFTVVIRHRGERHYLGSYPTEAEATQAFKAAAAERRGEFYAAKRDRSALVRGAAIFGRE